jgi:hypothetical protein
MLLKLLLLNNGCGDDELMIMFKTIFCFNLAFIFIFAVLASYGRLHVFTNQILLALSWNKVLVVYASQGLDI